MAELIDACASKYIKQKICSFPLYESILEKENLYYDDDKIQSTIVEVLQRNANWDQEREESWSKEDAEGVSDHKDLYLSIWS